MSAPRRSVFVAVGTDHHPFDRLCGWSDAWVAQARHPEVPVVLGVAVEGGTV